MSYPPGVTLTREPYVPELDRPSRGSDANPIFRPPSAPSRRIEPVGFAGLVREIDDDRPAPDPHFRPSDAERRELQRAATDSILRPAHLKRGTNFD